MNDLQNIKHREESKRNAMMSDRQKAELYLEALNWAFQNIPAVAERLTPRYCKE